MNQVYLNDEDRRKMYKSHPMVTHEYRIITPIIESAYRLIRDRVFMRKTGTFMYASPRMGKSTCAEAIRALLQREFPDVCIMGHIMEDSGRHETSLYVNILHSQGLSTPTRPVYHSVQRTLITHILTRLDLVKGNQYVLVIDEMQHLQEPEYDRLAALHNKLGDLGIRMTTIGFAQPEILDVRSALRRGQKSYVLARFLAEPIPFDGCVSKSDLEKILKAYDEVQHYPEDTDYTYTKFFAPEAFENGFRLVDYASTIWSKLKSAAGKSSDSIPMEHLCLTIEYLLLSSFELDNSKYKLSENQIDDAVEASNLADFSGLLALESEF
jgi:hypothetical protein